MEGWEKGGEREGGGAGRSTPKTFHETNPKLLQ